MLISGYTLIIETVRTSETSVYSNEITRRCIPEGFHHLIGRRENLKSHVICVLYESIILPVIWYGCEIWSVILREEHVEGDQEQAEVLRKIFGSKRREIRGH
jgi:hypothetical protein